MKKKKKILKRIILLLLIILIIIGILLIIAWKTQLTNQETKTEEQIQEEQLIQAKTKSLRSKGETQRMQDYLVTYLNYIETKQYEKAYDLLYSDFKTSYYPSLEFFTAYVKNTYFPIMRINFEDIQRQGQYYILSVELIDITNDLNTKEQKFIIYEEDVNDFTMSFQAI